MKITGKGCFDDYLTTEQRAKQERVFRERATRKPLKGLAARKGKASGRK